MSIARYDAGESGDFAATVRDSLGVAVPAANISAMTLRLTNAATGAVINARSGPGGVGGQDVLNNGQGVTVDSSGALVWRIVPAETAAVDSSRFNEEHIAEFVWTFNNGSGTETGRHIHRLFCSGLRSLTTFDDIREHGKDANPEDRLLIELLIDAFTRTAEGYCKRVFKYAEGVAETFTIRRNQWAVRVKRWPVTAVIELKEHDESDFSSATPATPATEYASIGRGLIEMRWRPYLEGLNAVRVTYDGGLARDVGDVPGDLREAASQQVRYWYQRKDSLGLTSESVNGVSVQHFAANLLPYVKETLDNYAVKVL